MAQYSNLISENIAPFDASVIGVYNSNNEKVGKIELGNLKTTLGNKLYSFGALADTHIGASTANSDLQIALTWLKSQGVAFAIVDGDTCDYATESNLQDFRSIINTYANYPVYCTNGNHELTTTDFTEDLWNTYIQNTMDYCFTYENDVFILLRINGNNGEINTFTSEQQSWLEGLLEKYKNCRIFLFTHPYINGINNGNYNDLYNVNILTTTSKYGSWLLNIMKSNKNVILFTGHSHFKWNVQNYCKTMNICNQVDGVETGYFVHLPSVASPRDGEGNRVIEDSEGAIIDVYEDCIVIRGRNFIDAKLVPISLYKLPVEQGTLPVTNYAITNNLTNATNSNSATIVAEGSSYNTTITANTNYSIKSITVTMNGEDITSSCVTDNNISISSVTGDIIITVTTESTSKPCTGITLNNTSLEFISKGVIQTLTATVTPSDTTDSITWESNNTSVATVSNGVVTSVGAGNCTITAKCGEQSVTCNITVSIEVPIVSLVWTEGLLINTTTGEESTSSNNSYSATDYIEMIDGYNYALNFNATLSDVGTDKSSYTCQVCYYDENKTFLSSSATLITQASTTTTNISIPVVNNAKYFRLRAKHRNVNSVTDYLSKFSITVS